jgi:glycosyltransferase involved in cell wall biosynthesis
MDRTRFANTVVTMTTPPGGDRRVLKDRLASADVPFDCLGMRRGLPSPLAAARLLRIIRRVRPHILQTWLYHADLLGLLVGKLARVPIIIWNVQCSFIDLTQYRRMSSLVLRSLIPLSQLPDTVLTNSESGRRFHEHLGYRPRKWLCLPNPLDVEQFKPDPDARLALRRELSLSDDAVLIGLVARFDPMKDHANFVAAAGMLSGQDHNLHYVLAGYGVDANNMQLKRATAATGAEERFHLLGERQDVNRVIAGLDISCSSSYGEGCPTVIGEAMASGVPCVVTDVGDSAILVDGTGRVVPPKDPGRLAEACRDLLDMSAAQRRRLGEAARERIIRKSSLPIVVGQYQQLYEDLANRR